MTQHPAPGTDHGEAQPRIINRLFGPDYGGPLSSFAEWHSFEIGCWVGLTAAQPALASAMAAALGIKLLKGGLTGELKRQVLREPHYAAVGAMLVYVGATLLAHGL